VHTHLAQLIVYFDLLYNLNLHIDLFAKVKPDFQLNFHANSLNSISCTIAEPDSRPCENKLPRSSFGSKLIKTLSIHKEKTHHVYSLTKQV
jgi:hypothetical protein